MAAVVDGGALAVGGRFWAGRVVWVGVERRRERVLGLGVRVSFLGWGYDGYDVMRKEEGFFWLDRHSDGVRCVQGILLLNAGSASVRPDIIAVLRAAKGLLQSHIRTSLMWSGIVYHSHSSALNPPPPSYQIPGIIANFFALYFPPSSFLYLLSFFFAHSAIWPTAIAMKSAVLQCLFTSKMAIQARLSKV